MAVKIREFKGDIVAQVPFEDRHRVQELKIGQWEPKWTCWKFAYSPVVAYILLETFKNEIESCSDDIYELAERFRLAHQVKHDEDPPPIPNLSDQAPTTWRHQRQAYNFSRYLPGVLLDMFMGTGKTLTTLSILANEKNDRVLVICPKSVIPVWWYESKLVRDSFLITLLNKGDTRKKDEYMRKNMELARCESRPHVVVVNYETFWREPLFKSILKNEWDIVIFDEVHRLKDPTGKASKAATKVRDVANKRLGLTGTPMPHSPMDIFGVYRALDPSVFGTNYHRFKMKYAVMGGYADKEVVDYKNREDLSRRFGLIAYQAPADVLDLPETLHTYRTAPLSSKAKKVYDSLDKELYAQVEEGEITPANAMVKVLRLQQLTSGYMKRDEDDQLVELGTEKKQMLRELLEDLPQDEPVVVFTRFKPDLANVKEVCQQVGRSCAEHSGRIHQLDEWQEGHYNVIAAQINSGKEGVDLSRAAYCVYYSIGHSLGDYEQSLSRTHRPGQTRKVQYFHLLMEGTVDLTVYKSLRKRREVIDSILAGERATMDDVAAIAATEKSEESNEEEVDISEMN